MTELLHVFVTRRLPGRVLDALAGLCELDVWEGRDPPDPETLRRRAAKANGLLCLLTDTVEAPLMDICPRLRVISNMAVRVDNIDLKAAADLGIAVGNTPDVLTDATADLAVSNLRFGLVGEPLPNPVPAGSSLTASDEEAAHA